MLLGLRSDGLIGGNLFEKAVILKEHDYDFMELVLSEENVNAYDAAWVKAIHRISNTANLPMLTLSMACARRLMEADDDTLDLYAQRLLTAVRYAAQFGSFSVLVASVEPSTDIEAQLPRFRRAFLPAADYAAHHGIALCLEPVAAYSHAALARLVRTLGHPGIRLYYDMGNCMNAGEDPVEQAWETGDLIGAVHIKGIHDYEFLDMPLAGILMALSYHRFDRTGCLEIEPFGENDHLREAMITLTALGYR